MEARLAAPPSDTAPSPWAEVESAPIVTVDSALRAITAMEITRARHMDAHLPAARRIAEVADSLGRPDLAMRAQLIVADIAARQGSPLQAAHDIEAVHDWASACNDRYIQARSSFLQCVVQFSIGDLPSARIHGVSSVELLPDDAPTAIRIDHLIMLAVAYGPAPQADQYYRYALDLTAETGDTDKTIGIHNNLAYVAWQGGDLAKATKHVELMLEQSTLRGRPLKASALETVATIYIASGRLADALDVLSPAVAEDASIPRGVNRGVLHTEPYALPECLLTLAAAHRGLGNLDDAQRCIDRAEVLANDRSLGQTSARVLQEQAKLCAAREDWRAAYRYHTEFHERATRLHFVEQEARARVVQASYEADERRRDTVRFRELAMRDALTGLYNRRFIDEQLKSLTAQSQSSRTALSAAIADADFFKRINDLHSHDVGDQVLRAMAAILDSTVVAPETVGRLGGEEFVILMPAVSGSDAVVRCEEIRAAIADYDWSSLVGDIPVTVSIGVTTAVDGQTSPAALLSDADRNLYAAKRSGRNKVVSDPI